MILRLPNSLNMRQGKAVPWLVLTATLSACSLLYELLIAKLLGFLTGNIVLWQSVTIGMYMLGLGLGTYFSEKVKPQDIYTRLFYIELALSIIAVVAISVIILLHIGYRYLFNNYLFSLEHLSAYDYLFGKKYLFFYVFIIASQAITILIGMLSGYELPLLIKIVQQKTQQGSGYNVILGCNYIGALIAGILFALLLQPYLQLGHIVVIVSSINLMGALYLWQFLSCNKHIASLYLASVFSLIVLVSSFYPQLIQWQMKVFYYYNTGINNPGAHSVSSLLTFLQQQPDIVRIKTPYQTIDIAQTQHKQQRAFSLFIDGHWQFNSAKIHSYHGGLAHIPMQLSSQIPKKILVLGGGDGLLINALLKYAPHIDSITHIELDPAMLKLAKNSLSQLNQHALEHPKVDTHIGDGFYYLRHTSAKFDAIFIDFPYPYNYDLARLYSVELFTYVKKRLTTAGFAAIDVPIFSQQELEQAGQHPQVSALKQHINNIIFNSVAAAKFAQLVPYKVRGEGFLLLRNSSSAQTPPASTIAFMPMTKIMPVNLQQTFPFSQDPRLINSIFQPTLWLQDANF
jgi:spermidine synthase